MVEVCEPDDPERPVLALGDEDEIQDPDDALVDQVGQDGQALPGHFRTWELDDQVADRTQSTVVGHRPLPPYGASLRAQRQLAARTLAFCASNSASVSTPCALRSTSWVSWDVTLPPVVPAASRTAESNASFC